MISGKCASPSSLAARATPRSGSTAALVALRGGAARRPARRGSRDAGVVSAPPGAAAGAASGEIASFNLGSVPQCGARMRSAYLVSRRMMAKLVYGWLVQVPVAAPDGGLSDLADERQHRRVAAYAVTAPRSC